MSTFISCREQFRFVGGSVAHRIYCAWPYKHGKSTINASWGSVCTPEANCTPQVRMAYWKTVISGKPFFLNIRYPTSQGNIWIKIAHWKYQTGISARYLISALLKYRIFDIGWEKWNQYIRYRLKQKYRISVRNNRYATPNHTHRHAPRLNEFLTMVQPYKGCQWSSVKKQLAQKM